MLKRLLREVLSQHARKPATALQRAGGDALTLKAWQDRRDTLGAPGTPAHQALADEFEAMIQAVSQRLVEARKSAFSEDLLLPWTRLGEWRLQDRQHALADRAFRQALRCRPMDGRAQEGLGLALLHLRQLDEAWLHFELAHRADPMNSEVLTHWGLVALDMGNLTAAAERFQKAVERNPRNPHAWHNLALCVTRMGHLELAVSQYRQAVEIAPDHGLAWSNLALALRQLNDLDGALAAARRACELKGHNNARVWTVLADVEADAGHLNEALGHVAQALALDPTHLGGLIALGKLHGAAGRFTAAEDAYQRALQQVPDSAEARGGLAQLLLQQERWAQAWPLYEARQHTADNPVRKLPVLPWQGEALADRSLLVHAEQGLGDIILFSSCLHDLQQLTQARISLEVPPRLATLYRRSFPTIEVLAHDQQDADTAWLGTPPRFERQIPIGSLPLHLRMSAAAFAPARAYLQADPQRQAHWRQTASASGQPRHLVGITWRGGLLFTGSRQRTIDLVDMLRALLRPLQEVGLDTTTQWVSLQHGAAAADLARVRDELGLHVAPGPAADCDMDELAAATSACDAVLTVCSTQVHLTGALGVPGLVLVPAQANWRYGHTGSAMPWYGSVELVRQARHGDWSTALQAVVPWLQRQLHDHPQDTAGAS